MCKIALRKSWLLLIVAACSIGCTVATQRVATGLNSPLFLTVAPGDNEHLYIVEQGGRLQALSRSDGSITQVLDISSLVVAGNEQGLLGLAFHPKFQSNRKLYVNLTAAGTGATQIWEFTAPARFGAIDAATKRLILEFAQPQANHNGG